MLGMMALISGGFTFLIWNSYRTARLRNTRAHDESAPGEPAPGERTAGEQS